MLLDVASEQENREFLLQKHFFALLSSVWKVASHVDRRQNLSPMQNGRCFDRSFFPSIGQHSQNFLKPSERMTFPNLAQSRNLLAAALDDAGSRQQDDKISVPNHGDDVPVTANQLDVTLEIQNEESDTFLFPSVINLSIQGTEPPPSLNKQTGEDDHLRACGSVAEERFRYDWIQEHGF